MELRLKDTVLALAEKNAVTFDSEFEVWYTFLAGSTAEENRCIRRRVQKGITTCSFARRFTQPNGEVAITERVITVKEFNALHSQRDSSLTSFSRVRRCFFHADLYFELDEHKDFMMLQAEVPPEMEARTAEFPMPDWCAPFVLREITGEPQYSLYNTAIKEQKASAPCTV
eukprot:TRINITY_DN3043_c0_g1_i2.p7 TRINITY_DN3043_c0_g1~~TRINITY_DN3043_c0_g1_i2.p7  ORF type:complete len:171 (-),score=56.05 TRINITY_DN3043_c0_g1_i2:650-1162(-)